MPTDIRRLVKGRFVFSATAAAVCFVTERDTGGLLLLSTARS